MIIRYLSHKLTVYHSQISWEKNTQFHMTCHIYQHMWLVIRVSFPEHCWRGFCWLPKGYDCGGMNPCCVVFTPNQLNIITFHFSGLNLLYLACITNDRKAQANRDILFSTFILAHEPWKWKIKIVILMELSWLWGRLFQMWLNSICIHDITRCGCVLPFGSFIEKTWTYMF